jgi:hypothetical protein
MNSDGKTFLIHFFHIFYFVHTFNSYPGFFSVSRADPNNLVRCQLNLNYQSVALDELVLLQDKLLLPETRTTLNSMTSESGKINTKGGGF